MGARNQGLKGQRVGHDGHGHPGGLRAVLLVQFPGDIPVYIRVIPGLRAQQPRRLSHARLQGSQAVRHQTLGQAGIFQQAGQRRDAAAQPAAGRPARRLRPRPRSGDRRACRAGKAVQAVFVLRLRHGPRQFLLRAGPQSLGQTQRQYLFQLLRGIGQALAQARFGILLHRPGRRELRLDHTRRAARQDDIRAPPGFFHNRRLLGGHAPVRVLFPQRRRQGRVHNGLGIFRHLLRRAGFYPHPNPLPEGEGEEGALSSLPSPFGRGTEGEGRKRRTRAFVSVKSRASLPPSCNIRARLATVTGALSHNACAFSSVRKAGSEGAPLCEPETSAPGTPRSRTFARLRTEPPLGP